MNNLISSRVFFTHKQPLIGVDNSKLQKEIAEGCNRMIVLKSRKGRTYFGSYAWVVLLLILFIILAAKWPPLKLFILEILGKIFGT